ncbi:MAG: sensor histidine kinase [Phycisphaeraceae bacterium]
MTDPPNNPPADERSDELAEIIRAYNQVTEKLQQSHEKLKGEVLRLRQELASTNAQLQRSKRLSALGEMAAGIAHEIRNPLAAIQLYAGMAEDDLTGDDLQVDTAADSVHKIAAAVRGLNGIVNDVLSFAREIEPSVHPVHLPELLDRAVEAHRPAIDAANVEVRRHDEADFTLHADATLLHQAVLNLVRNAVDAMTDQPRRVLTLGIEPEDAGCAIVVRDTGPGIDADDIDRIFNPFFTTRNTGTGLGLAIVHRIVDAHGGTIAAHNDGGAVFRLSLPDAASQRTGRLSHQSTAPETPRAIEQPEGAFA